jgi:hypothetical protein
MGFVPSVFASTAVSEEVQKYKKGRWPGCSIAKRTWILAIEYTRVTMVVNNTQHLWPGGS